MQLYHVLLLVVTQGWQQAPPSVLSAPQLKPMMISTCVQVAMHVYV
jgi:hypothetical protein